MAPPQWAYQVENFVNEPDEELVCSICRSVFCEPAMCPCDHVFCRACISKWIQTNRNCPICRKRASNSSIKQAVPIVKNIIMKLMVNCHNKTLGCTAQFSLESSEAHMKECEYELVQCKNKPCKDRLFRKDIAEHERSDCPHRYIKCKTCGSKMPTPAVPEKHDCIRAMQLRLRRKNIMIRKKNNRIKQLKNENKALKAASQNSEQSLSRSSHDFESSLSPEEIMINMAEFSSTSSSFSSDSEDSSENSIIIFTNSSLNQSDNVDSDSFFTFMDDREDSIEYSRNERRSPREFVSEYRHVESQTANDLPLEDQPNDLSSGRNNTSGVEVDRSSIEAAFSELAAAASALSAAEERPERRRPMKRRPTTQKPAKRRFLHSLCGSDNDEDESVARDARPCFQVTLNRRSTGENSAENNRGDDSNLPVEAGPSSRVETAAGSSTSVDASSDAKSKYHLKCKLNQKHAKHTNSVGENSASTQQSVAPRNAMFERTLTLLEQYNLESDPEWLPSYASHRGDTTSESNSDETEFVSDSSSSDLSDCDSNNENRDIGVPDFVKWIFNESSDDDDPDWHPENY